MNKKSVRSNENKPLILQFPVVDNGFSWQCTLRIGSQYETNQLSIMLPYHIRRCEEQATTRYIEQHNQQSFLGKLVYDKSKRLIHYQREYSTQTQFLDYAQYILRSSIAIASAQLVCIMGIAENLVTVEEALLWAQNPDRKEDAA